VNRRLTLKREQLAPLAPNDLSAVVAAYGQGVQSLTGVYPTLNTPCPTVQECIRETPLCPTEL